MKVPPFSYDHFDLPPVLYAVAEMLSVTNDAAPTTRYARLRGMGAAKPQMKSAAVADVVFESEMVPVTEESGMAMSMDNADMGRTTDIELRTDFAETAFFYPQLHTNVQGEVSFSFRMPQSLTTWNFRGYAHTQDMMTGQMDATAVTSKEFMLTPNLPRFVRVGDHTSMAASVSNLTGKNLSGTVKLVLFDPMTDQVISTQQKKFNAGAGQSVGVSFLFTVTDKYEILGCRMIAEGGNFSDGEQHLLPVLSDKENLTETLPMPVRGEQTRTFLW